ncbi:MAG: hypothetical protein ACYDA5_08665 [Vulcanimicrobiaceae bacterium]
MSHRPRVQHQTRFARARRNMLLRAGIWAFIVVFAFSIAGGMIIIAQSIHH